MPRIVPATGISEAILDCVEVSGRHEVISNVAKLIRADRRAVLERAIEALEIMAGSPLGDAHSEHALRAGAERLRKMMEENE